MFEGLNLKPGVVNFITVSHDNDCPVIFSQDITECICGDNVEINTHNDFDRFMHSITQSRKARREALRQAARAIKKAKKAKKGGTK